MVNLVTSLQELYADTSLYRSDPALFPYAEKLPHVFRAEAAYGCPWSVCTYCSHFKSEPHHIKTLDQYVHDVDAAFEIIGKRSALAQSLQRVYLTGSDVLEIPPSVLREEVLHTRRRFEEYTGKSPRRIAMYARARSILEDDINNLRELHFANGVNILFYVGVESGSTAVSDYVCKGVTFEENVLAGQMATDARIDLSVMIMPGLGGKRLSEDHIQKTAELLSRIKPKFITFIGIDAEPGTVYQRRMNEEIAAGTNRPLTDIELFNQISEIIHHMSFFPTTIGYHDASIHTVSHNPFSFGSRRIMSVYNKRDLEYELEHELPFIIARRKRHELLFQPFLEKPALFELIVPEGDASSSKTDYSIQSREGIDTVVKLMIMHPRGDTFFWKKDPSQPFYSTCTYLGVTNAFNFASHHFIGEIDITPSNKSLQSVSERTGIPLTELQEIYAIKNRHAREIALFYITASLPDNIGAVLRREDKRKRRITQERCRRQMQAA